MNSIKVPKTLFRSGTMEKSDDGNLRLSICSEEPYKRFDWWSGTEYWEVIDHSAKALNVSRLKAGAPLLFNHDRHVLLGTLSNPVVEGGRCYVDAKLSQAADTDSFRTKIAEGVLRDTSIGYSIEDEGEEIGKKDGLPILKFKTTIFEASLVTVPADPSVGVGRSRAQSEEGVTITIRGTVLDKIDKPEDKRAMSDTAVDTKPEQKIDIVAERKSALEEFKGKCKRIDDYVANLKNEQWKAAAAEVAIKHKAGDADYNAFVTEAINSYEGVRKVTASDTPDIGMSKKDVKRFSLLRAIRCMAENERLDGHEKVCCDAAQKQMGRELTKPRSFIIPEEVSRSHDEELFRQMLMQRAQLAGVFSAGGATVETEFGPLIELLRNQTVLGKLGITYLDGLVGDFVLPQQLTGCVAYWVSETGTITDSEATFGQKAMTPHRLGATILLSMQFMKQSSLSVDAWVRQELDTVMALKKDLAGLLGTGTGGEPLGVANTTGINATVTYGGAATWADVVEHETGIAVDNADIGTMGFALSSATVGKWKTILKDSVAGAGYLLEGGADNMSANGYPVRRTNQIGSGNQSFFGVWRQFLQAMWAGREIIVNPYSNDTTGQVRVTMQELTDNLVRQPLAFNVSTDSAAA
jgi:HK97 family phage major capsid protein